MPKVSVIVPVYNTEKYLKKCLDSLVQQTLHEIEIVLVDDGSTDGSTAMIQEYAEKYPDKVVAIYKQNGGQASARNIGIAKCTGEYIGFLDSDDFVKHEMFEKLYLCAKKGNCDYVGCAYTDTEYRNGELHVLVPYVGNKRCEHVKEMYIGGIVSPFINFYRGDMLRNSGVTFPEGVIYEDTAFWVNLIPFLNKIDYVEEALAYRVRHENSTTTITKPEKVAQIFIVMDTIIRFYQEHGFYDTYRDEIEYFIVRVLLCSSMRRIYHVADKGKQKALIDNTYQYIRTHFPGYKKNKYLTGGKINLYMRFASPAMNKVICKIKK